MLSRSPLVIPVAVVAIAGFLLAQQDQPADFAATLRQLQDSLKQVRAEVKRLQDTITRLTKENKNAESRTARESKNAKALPPVPSSPAPAPVAASAFQKAQDAYKQGQVLENRKLYAQAVEVFGQAIGLDASNDSAFLHRALSYSQLGDHASAIADFNQSLVLQPNNSRAYLGRASAYASLGQGTAALADANEASVRDPKNSDVFVLRGRLYQQQGEMQKALADYTTAVSLAPNSEKVYLARAEAYRAGNQAPLALADCDAAVRINPNSIAAYLCRAETYQLLGAPSRVLEEVNHAVVAAEVFQQQTPLLSGLTRSIQADTQTQPPKAPAPPVVAVLAPATVDVAAPVAAPATRTSPPQAPPPASLLSVHPPNGLPTSSPRQTLPVNANAIQLERLGRLRNSEEGFQEALGLLSRAIELDPQLASAYNARGFAHLRLAHLDPAIADFSEAIRLRASYANAYHNRAVARRKKGDKTGAEDDARKATEMLSSSVQRAEVTTARR